MFDTVIQEDIKSIHRLVKEIHAMAVDLSKLQASTDRLTKAVEALIAVHTDPAVQAAVDSVADALDAEAVKAEAAVAPVV